MKIRIRTDFDTIKYHVYAYYINYSLVFSMLDLLQLIITRSHPINFNFIGKITIIILSTYYILHIMLNKIYLVSEWAFYFSVWGLVMCTALICASSYSDLIAETAFEGVTHILIPIVLISGLDNFYELLNASKKYVVIGIFYCALQMLLPTSSNVSYFTFSHATLIVSTLSLALALYGEKKYIFFFAIYFVTSFLFGGRVSLLCYLVELALFSILNFKDRKTFFYFVLAISGVAILSVYYDQIIQLIASIFPSNRLVAFLTGQKVDNSRSIMNGTLIAEVIRSPFKVRGILSDRIRIATLFNLSENARLSAWYCHNVIVEILYDFGIWGFFLLVYIVVVTIKDYIYIAYDKKDISAVIWMLTIISFSMKLMVSSSYLIDFATGTFIGMLLLIRKQKHSFRGKRDLQKSVKE